MSAQDETLDRYHALMRLNAEAQLFRAGRQAGLYQRLRSGQATAQQLVEALGLEPRLTGLLLDALVAMGVVEKYGDDYALAAVTRLLCEYDHDLGDQEWEGLVERLHETEAAGPYDQEAISQESSQAYFDAATATQWTHTGAAKQAAEILDIGGERSGRHILDLGCGSAVWSAAMAFTDPTSRVTAIDLGPRLAAARRTIDSIELGERYEFVEADPLACSLPEAGFDLVLMAGRLSGYSPEADAIAFQRARAALRPGGEVVIIDLFRGPGKPKLNEAVEALRVANRTKSGGARDAEAMRGLLTEQGFRNCQFAFLAASRQGWGLLVASK